MNNLLAEALKRLVDLKDLKDREGKSGYYETHQPAAWEQARKALAQYNAVEPQKRNLKYFIEDLRNGKWLCLGEMFDTSKDMAAQRESQWTDDPNLALSWNTKKEAEDYNKKYWNMADIEVTEHEFPSLSQPGSLQGDMEPINFLELARKEGLQWSELNSKWFIKGTFEYRTEEQLYELFKQEACASEHKSDREPEGIDEAYIRKFLIDNRVIRTELQDEYTQLLLLFYNHITRK